MTAKQMRAEFKAWVQECGCDTDGAWSAWQAAWNRRAALSLPAGEPAPPPRQSLTEAAAIGMAREYQAWIDFFHRGDGSYDDFLRKHVLPHEPAAPNKD